MFQAKDASDPGLDSRSYIFGGTGYASYFWWNWLG